MRAVIALIVMPLVVLAPIVPFAGEEIKGFAGINLGDFWKSSKNVMEDVPFTINENRCSAKIMVYVTPEDNRIYSIDVLFNKKNAPCSLSDSDIIRAYETKYGRPSPITTLTPEGSQPLGTGKSWGNTTFIIGGRSGMESTLSLLFNSLDQVRKSEGQLAADDLLKQSHQFIRNMFSKIGSGRSVQLVHPPSTMLIASYIDWQLFQDSINKRIEERVDKSRKELDKAKKKLGDL